MTREEAIEILNRDDDSMRKGYFCINDFEAIEVLKSVEPCEDCVSRAELKKWLDMNFSFGGASRKIELFDRLDKELPPVTPTRVETVTDFADKCRECGREKVLDKIRAEIEAIEDGISSYHNDRPWIFKDEALAIIDKYKAEKESENGEN